MAANLNQKYTLEEYFELERTSDARWEFFDGEVYCMSGASESYDEIETNIIAALKPRLANSNCRIFSSNLRVKVPAMPAYRYPDVSASCGEAKFEKIGGVDALVNPNLIIEVLSDSTEKYDRGNKFTQYKSIESFSEYISIARDRAHVTQIFRRADEWIYRDFTSINESVQLSSLTCQLSLTEIYRNVKFPPIVEPLIERG